MSVQHVDYIIVGGGLAGATLATRFLQGRQSFAWFDTPQQNRASLVAAGLFNPITNKVMNKTWRADEFFESLYPFYRDAEKLTGQTFFYPRPMYRPFLSVEEQNSWMAKSGEPTMEKFIKEITTESKFGHEIHDPFGGIIVDRCGYVDVPVFLNSVKDLAKAQQLYFEESFLHDDVTIEGTVFYHGLEAKALIFCEGTAVKVNPYFKWTPVNPLKGETLLVKIDESLSQIYNRGVYLVPSENGSYKVGATYQHHSPAGSTAEGRAELVEKLENLLALGYKIESQDWGFRPTITDRKPVLGPHPEHAQLIIFNALGTKGVSLAPHFSGVLAAWLAGKNPIEKDVNISRFYPLYSKF